MPVLLVGQALVLLAPRIPIWLIMFLPQRRPLAAAVATTPPPPCNLLQALITAGMWQIMDMRLARRTVLAGLALACTSGSAISAVAQDAGSPSGPRPFGHGTPHLSRLRAGDKVGLVAPAGFIADQDELDFIFDTVRAMELEPVAAPNLLSRFGYLAGTDEERAASVNAMFARPDIAAIFAVRGGWGCARILPLLDYATISANPKIFAGFSDITALHCAFAAMKVPFPTFHSPNAGASWPQAAWSAFRQMLFEGTLPTYVPPAGRADRLVQREGRVTTLSPGTARGRMLGGNLTVLTALAGTAYLPDFDGAILFLEDTNEAQYRIDRMLTQLRLAGILGRVAGVAFGQCTGCTNEGASYGNFTLNQVLEQHLAQLGVPAFAGAMIGHIANQITIPMGAEVEMDANQGSIRVLEPVVA